MSESTQKVIISTSAAQLCSNARRKDIEHNPVVVLKAAELAQINQYRLLPWRNQSFIDLRESIERLQQGTIPSDQLSSPRASTGSNVCSRCRMRRAASGRMVLIPTGMRDRSRPATQGVEEEEGFNEREPMVDCEAIYKPFDRSATFTERMCLLLVI